MTDGDGTHAWDRYASVTVEAAAALVDVDADTIRHWSESGSLEIERRGDMDVVRLDQVRAMTSASQVGAGRGSSSRGSLRALLRDATIVESLSVSGLQQQVREKTGSLS